MNSNDHEEEKVSVQSDTEDIANHFFFPSSLFSSVDLSNAHSRASGRRSLRSMNFPACFATRGLGYPADRAGKY